MTDGATLMLALRMVASLAVVLGVLVLTVRFLERRGVGRGGSSRGRRDVEVLQRTPLSKGASVQVVRAGSHVLVLGVTDSAVQVLTELDPSEAQGEAEPTKGAITDARPALTSFASPTLVNAVARITGKPGFRSAVQAQGHLAQNIADRLSRGEGRHRVGKVGH